MDDAPPIAPRRPHSRALISIVPFAALLGAAMAAPLAPRLLPATTPLYAARAGDRVAYAARADLARADLVARFADAVVARGAAASRRQRLRAELAAGIPAGPVPALASPSACAALLRGWALVLRGLASSDLETSRASPGAERVASGTIGDSIEQTARSADAGALEGAFALEQAAWRRWLESEARRLPPARRAELWSEWRSRMRSRADALEAIAAPIEAKVSTFQRLIVPLHARVRAIELEPLVPDPSAVLALLPIEPAAVTVQAVRSSWLPPIGGGAMAGALLGICALLAVRALRSPRPSKRDASERILAVVALPTSERAWLQLVAGGTRERVARAVCELAARSLARGERVVMIDLGARLDLHEWFRLSPRLGWSDVAHDGLPTLGVLQNGGFTGLFLLARGRPTAVLDWLPLDRVLEELRPHFGRVVMAVDRDVPALLGGLLAGRLIDGWWSGPGSAARGTGARIADRVAIALLDINLSPIPQASLEGLEARLAQLALSGDSRPAGHPDESNDSTPPAIPPRISTPVVLDCDLQLRQRLRFLAWMRRIQAERRSRETETATRH